MVHIALTENPTKTLTIFTSIQTICHQSLNKFQNQLKKESQFCHNLNIFFRRESAIYYEKCLKIVSTTKTKQSKQREKKK